MTNELYTIRQSRPNFFLFFWMLTLGDRKHQTSKKRIKGETNPLTDISIVSNPFMSGVVNLRILVPSAAAPRWYDVMKIG